MAMVVRSNIMALNANRQLGINNSSVSKNLEKLSSGFKINRAGDDASGLAISEKMKAQIKGLETASANSQDGISLVQTAEGALTEVHDMLNRMTELATKSANGTIQDAVDRDAIQSEVNALNEEIDRISQSTNFNGINLLDGSLGLNAKAIKLGSTLASTGLQTGAAISLNGKLGTSTAATTHLSSASRAQGNPGFSVDFGDLVFDGTASATAANVTVTVGGVGVTVAVGVGKKLTAASIAAEVVKKFNNQTIGSTTNSVGAAGGLYFKATAAGSKVTFAYAGIAASGTKAKPTDEFTQVQADAANAVLSNTVTVGAMPTKVVQSGDFFHNNMDVKNATIKQAGGRAGIDLTLDGDVVKNGGRLTIDGKTFVFKTDKTSTVTAGASETLIDVSNDALYSTTAARVAEAIDQISRSGSTNFKFEAKSGTVLHIDQLTTSTVSYDYDKLKDVFAARGADTTATNAGSKVTIDGSKLRDGNTITIDNTTYKFVKASSGGANEVVLGTNGADAITNLLTKLNTAGSGVTASANGNDVTVRAGSTNGKSPVISGEGLTLQIGDTGDTFNMVNVKVADMSAGGLGVRNLDVSNADSARASIQTIKTAINTVSTNRANMGALQNRLEHTINNLDVAAENMSAANSRVRDTDMAKQMMEYTKMNVLTQAAQAMLAQANQQPQSILQLLQ